MSQTEETIVKVQLPLPLGSHGPALIYAEGKRKMSTQTAEGTWWDHEMRKAGLAKAFFRATYSPDKGWSMLSRVEDQPW